MIKQGIEDSENQTEDVRTLVKNSENHYTLTKLVVPEVLR